MLEQLYIENIAVIERASITFGPGFTVLTGETGAGKSIIIDAIHAVLGERTSKELVRTGADRASVAAHFSDLDGETLALLEKNGIPAEEDGSLLIQREIRLEGRSLCRMNGAPVTVSMLREIAPRLVSIHGQHESYDLLSPDMHLGYLDSFAGLEEELARYRECYHSLRQIQKQLEAFNTDEGEKARRQDLLRFQIAELEEAGVTPGEQEELRLQRERIRSSEKIAAALEKVRGLLLGDENRDGLLTGLSLAAGELSKTGDLLPEAEAAADKLTQAKFLAEEADGLLSGAAVDFDPARLDEIETRLDLLYHLGLKYGDTEEKMLVFLEACRQELHHIEFADEERAELEGRYEQEKEQAIRLAKDISARRKQAAQTFASQVKSELTFLNMPHVEFLARIERVPLTTMGCDRLQFLVSANAGEEPRPLSKIASGGELSRIMLAIKTVLSGKDKVPTLIFDEVDSGVSGAAAEKIGLKLRQAAENRQVLCITHLAQIAALAREHFQISKHVEGERTFTRVTPLDFEGRKLELARIIGGEAVTPLQLEMAQEMLRRA